MPKMNISKSIKINAKPEEVFSKLNDFNHWTAWSPWIITEPETKVTVDSDSKSYSWVGNRTGEGNMKITAEKENESLDIDLEFLKPWKSKAKVGFKIKPEGEGTQVTWWMDSSLPFFLFWMKNMMTAFVGMDYERGLNLLKDYTEDGEVHSKIEFTGPTDFEGCNYIGFKTEAKFEEMGTSMEAEFGKLMEWAKENPENAGEKPLSIYHKWDPVKRITSYTAAWPVKEVPAELPNGMTSGSIPATKVNTIGHIGPYSHIGNAWSTQFSMHRSKSFKLNKKIDPFEVYINSPMEVDEKELKTEIHMAMK